ncbi:MAG TPA: alpha/beta hydrolase, partial [Chitinophagaceae bacterium]
LTTTLSYDRAGLGQSEYHGEKKDLKTLAMELDQVIRHAKIHAPFILVGHSLGCQIIKKYAATHAANLKGCVLIDPGYNEDSLKAIISDSLWIEREAAIKKYQVQFNPAQQAEDDNRKAIDIETDAITDVFRFPIVFFTATMVTEFPASAEEQRVKMQAHLAWLRKMPRAQHILVNTSWHYIHVDEPQLVINAIESLLK